MYMQGRSTIPVRYLEVLYAEPYDAKSIGRNDDDAMLM